MAASLFVCSVHIYEIMEPGAAQVFLSSLSNNFINFFIIYLEQKWVDLKYIVNIKQMERSWMKEECSLHEFVVSKNSNAALLLRLKWKSADEMRFVLNEAENFGHNHF